jgi:hypothetical protein
LKSPPWLGWPLWNICVTNYQGYVPLVINTSRSFSHSRLITGFVARLTRRVPLVEQELLTLREHLSSPPVFCGVRVTRSLVLYVCFVDRCLSFCTFSFGHCVICSSIYGFWLPLWYLQTLLTVAIFFISEYFKLEWYNNQMDLVILFIHPDIYMVCLAIPSYSLIFCRMCMSTRFWWSGRGHHLCLTDTLHLKKITPNKTTLSIIIKCGGILLF